VPRSLFCRGAAPASRLQSRTFLVFMSVPWQTSTPDPSYPRLTVSDTYNLENIRLAGLVLSGPSVMCPDAMAVCGCRQSLSVWLLCGLRHQAPGPHDPYRPASCPSPGTRAAAHCGIWPHSPLLALGLTLITGPLSDSSAPESHGNQPPSWD
jgi:hypothetical protein